jgi:Sulfotransferase family
VSRADSPLRDRMIFVVGARRSGTNWLQRIVNAHPDVVGVPSETYLFSRGILPLTERFQHGASGSHSLAVIYMDRGAFLDALRDFCDAVFEGLIGVLQPGARRLCERTPEHTRCLALIGEVYPDAHVVHIVRDGRDVARSLASQEWGPDSIREAAEEWVTSVTAARRDGQALEHYHEVGYEAMLAEPRRHIAALYEALALDASPAVVDAAVLEAAVPFNVDPGLPTVATGKWRDRFSAADLDAFTAVAGPLLAELGYQAAPLLAAHTPRPGQSVVKGWTMANGARHRVRALARRAVSRAGLIDHDAVANRRIHRRLFEIQDVVDGLLNAIAARRFDDIAELVAPSARYRVVDAAGDWQARGPEGLARFVEVVRDDPALAGRQLRADVHPAAPSFTVVASYRTADGATHDRALVVVAEQARIDSLVYYRLPLSEG